MPDANYFSSMSMSNNNSHSPWASTGGLGGGGQVGLLTTTAMPPPLAPHGLTSSNEEYGIREVWNNNLEEEFKQICQIVTKYPFVAMDTEFPGVVARPIGKIGLSTPEVLYLKLWA